MQLELKINYMQSGMFCCSFFTALDGYAFYRYCIPMDSPRPLLPTELEFFTKGIGKG